MNIDHVHFYVEDAQQWQDWFVQKLGFRVISSQSNSDRLTIAVGQQAIRVHLSSPRSENSLVAQYLRQHPPGVADVAFQVKNLEATIERAVAVGAKVVQPVHWQLDESVDQKVAQLQGWGDLRHTLIEQRPISANHSAAKLKLVEKPEFIGIDHVVLNVKRGELQPALSWYEAVFGFERQQNFTIQTNYSALCSQVLRHPEGAVQFPINEPGSAGSQIQEFLDLNGGSGIQHIALSTRQIVPLIAQLRQKGIQFLNVPASYYDQLQQRPGFQLSFSEWQSIAQQEVLVDWQPQEPRAMLLQTFTQPIFEQPTFFFELIERRSYRVNQQLQFATGFGEGNFRALFEAIEREQMKRGSLQIEDQIKDTKAQKTSVSAPSY